MVKATNHITIKEFARRTGLTQSYVRSLISAPPGEQPKIPTICPIPGMQRPRLIDPVLVAVWKRQNVIGRPRISAQKKKRKKRKAA